MPDPTFGTQRFTLSLWSDVMHTDLNLPEVDADGLEIYEYQIEYRVVGVEVFNPDYDPKTMAFDQETIPGRVEGEDDQ